MPIPLLLAAAAVKGAVGLGQALFSGKKRKEKAADKAIDDISTYQVPTETKQMYESAKMDATTGLSGASKLLATEGAAKAGKAAMGASTERKGGLGMIGAIQKAGQQAGLAIAGQEEAALAGKKAALRGATTALVGEKGKAFASKQEKEQLKAKVALGKSAAAKESAAQGWAMVGSAAGDVMKNAAPGTTIFNKKQKKNPPAGYVYEDGE